MESTEKIVVAYPEMIYLGDDSLPALRKAQHGIYEIRIPYGEMLRHNLPREIRGDGKYFIPERIIIEFKKRTE